MTTTLITGGNKGLGYEAGRRLLEMGHDVWIGARDEDRGKKAAAELGGRFVQLDVTSDQSVTAAVETIGRLDVLVNNAGIAAGWENPGNPSVDEMRAVFETNVFGVVRCFHAFLPLLQAADCGVVVNVSSGLGSVALTLRQDYHRTPAAYGSSKAAVNMLTAQWSVAFPELRINAADPGYTATDLNANTGTQTVTEGTDAIVELATVGHDGPTGTYLSRHGVVPW
jgi:NAD(P)-dependent dehydrogenase (short-subunit alcohol dehydrogenase family)